MEVIEVIQNHTAYFRCTVEGNPTPSIMWLKDKVPLLDFPYENMRQLSNGQQLELRNVQVSQRWMPTACIC